MVNNACIYPIEHAPREHHEYPGAQYALPADDAERQRLVIQHNALKKIFENRILIAPVTLTPNDRVLDIGTGPGLWVLDLAQSVDPAVHIVAVDITSRLFPASPAENVKFQVESVISLPSGWTDTFTLVHQRLLMLALQIPEWLQAVREIHRVLRPGGWVQLGESEPWYEGEAPDKPCVEKVVSMYRRLIESRNLYVDCAQNMRALLEEVGFVDIHAEQRSVLLGKWAGKDGAFNAINYTGVFQGLKTPILEAGGYGVVTTESEYDALVEGVKKEYDEGVGSKREFYIFWARKPGNY
ncbi:S-adenosyl-L-methionine-dependent methyltransferase [Mycena venus]|uniref:S-adenosyl-L-methionine-dependent methyltransferase n=1 Tax=Mycena venus TaxID=2733690 RepID=A0A8H7CMA5_9AGAR|nr:S-adenosyl-L-methionine-dependent methyltransferase [Mycena venus]